MQAKWFWLGLMCLEISSLAQATVELPKSTEHLLVEEIEMRLVFGRLRLVFDDLASQCHQRSCKRQGNEHRAYIEDGVEHRQLELRRCRKKMFEERAETIEKAREIGKDSCKSVEIDSINYHYQDFYVGGFSCYVGVQLAKNSPYGRIIFGNWKPAKK